MKRMKESQHNNKSLIDSYKLTKKKQGRHQNNLENLIHDLPLNNFPVQYFTKQRISLFVLCFQKAHEFCQKT